MRLLIAQLNPTIGAFRSNSTHILKTIAQGQKEGVDLILFPELAVCGYPPDDLLLMPDFVEACVHWTQKIAHAATGLSIILGTVRPSAPSSEKPLHNSAAIIVDGEIVGYHDKMLLPTYDVFDEHRYFQPGSEATVHRIAGKKVGITICEDLWVHAERFVFTEYYCDPVALLRPHTPDLLLNLSASPYGWQKRDVRYQVLAHAARDLKCPAILCNQVGGNDSLIFDGHSLVVDETGALRAEGVSFDEDLLTIDLQQLPKPTPHKSDPVEDIYHALVLGVRDYFRKNGFKQALVGLSGGVDSALVACIAVEALGKENVRAVSMPSRYSSTDSLEDAIELAKRLDIRCDVIPIEEPLKAFEELLTPYFEGKEADATEENLQARTRGIILMALSNKHGAIVLSTGNKSEMATGYATLYGDLCGGLAVINDVGKLQVYELARAINARAALIPERILTKAPSAELAPDQKDSDSLPPYLIVDAVLEDYVENHLPPKEIADRRQIDLEIVEDLVHRVHLNEYKRRQAPPGLRVTERAFSVGRRFPIVQRWR